MPPRVGPPPALRVCGCLTARVDLLPLAERELAAAFGLVALRSPRFPFDDTDYYRDEMGAGLTRTWFCFRRLVAPEELAGSRLLTAIIEEKLAGGGKRRVNLDPGYLDLGKLVLASTKEAPDKIYLGSGVWAHTCLRYRNGGFEAPDHSFPDFRSGRYAGFFTEARRLYKEALREARSAGV